jgi:transcriptional regulator with XRE-family HTH domain
MIFPMETDEMTKPAKDTRHTPRSLRVVRGLTQRQVAAVAGVTEKTVFELETGEDVTLDTIRSIARALEVTPDTLVAAHEVERERRGTSRARPRSKKPGQGSRRVA